MSGGHWDYIQSRIGDVASDIVHIVAREMNGRCYHSHHDCKQDCGYRVCDCKYDDFLRAAQVIYDGSNMVHAVDYVVCGDTSSERIDNIFRKRIGDSKDIVVEIIEENRNTFYVVSPINLYSPLYTAKTKQEALDWLDNPLRVTWVLING